MVAGLLKPGAVLNSTYRIEELVGEGGTGEVYRAVNTASERTVAIKILKEQFSQDPKFIDLMRRELLHNVSDDAVVRYYDLLRTAEDQGGLYFLVMDYIKGPPLSDLMRKGPVSVDMLMILAKHVAQGLAACHRASIFHRDISPDNIILRDGDPAQSVLIDFGIAKDVRPDAKTVVGGGFAGKYEYAAPEQLDGVADSRSDIYSFGMTLLAAARGESPKLGTSFLEIVKAKHSEVDTAGVSEPLRGIVDAMVRPAPDDRPQSAEDLLRLMGGGTSEPGIESLLAEESASERAGASGGNPATLVPDSKKKSKGGLVGALVAVALAGGAGAFFTIGPGAGMLSGGLEDASPYAMTIRYDGSAVTVAGNAPSAEAAAKLARTLTERLPGDVAPGSLTPASGAPNDAWQATVAALAIELAKLENGELRLRDDQITLEGDATSEAVKAQIERTARTIARNGDYRIALTLATPDPTIAVLSDPEPAPEPEVTAQPEPAPSAPIRQPEVPEIPDRIATVDPDPPAEPDPAPTPEPAVRQPEVPAQTDRTPLQPERVPEPEPETAVVDPEPEPGAPPAAALSDPGPEETQVAVLPDPPPTPPIEQRLRRDVVEGILEANQTCGPLTVRSASSRGFGATETLRINGDLPTVEAEGALRDALAEIADGRRIDTTGISILNPSVCMVKDVMPPRNSGPASLLYNSALTGDLVQGDALKPNDQAVVTFAAPEDLDGNLYVFIVDNEFNTIHLYPMQTKPETRLSKIGTVENGKRRVQLSWPMPEGSRTQPVLAFTEPYGIAMMFVVVTEKDAELFPHVRAGVEDTRELTPLLADVIAQARLRGSILSHIQRFILVDED